MIHVHFFHPGTEYHTASALTYLTALNDISVTYMNILKGEVKRSYALVHTVLSATRKKQNLTSRDGRTEVGDKRAPLVSSHKIVLEPQILLPSV
jgi:hypothetical protein